MFKKALLTLTLLFTTLLAHADDYTAGPLLIHDPWSMALPPNAPAVAAYFTIENTGDTEDRLLSVDSPVAGQAQLHEHIEADGLMKMQHVQAVAILPQGKVTFAPMAYHVMLLDLKDRSQLAAGKRFPLTLHFEKAGDVSVEVVIQQQASGHHQH